MAPSSMPMSEGDQQATHGSAAARSSHVDDGAGIPSSSSIKGQRALDVLNLCLGSFEMGGQSVQRANVVCSC
jgi:hypothetical protein